HLLYGRTIIVALDPQRARQRYARSCVDTIRLAKFLQRFRSAPPAGLGPRRSAASHDLSRRSGFLSNATRDSPIERVRESRSHLRCQPATGFERGLVLRRLQPGHPRDPPAPPTFVTRAVS